MKTETIYKLTDQNRQTRNNQKWNLNEWVETTKEGGLCSSGQLHAYTHPLLAAFLYPIHVNFKKPILFIGEATGPCLNDGLKVGYKRMRVTKQIPMPEITLVQMVAFGILCALEVHQEPSFTKWAEDWLSGKDRSREAAARVRARVRAAWAAVEAATWAARVRARVRAATWAARVRAAEYALKANPNLDLIKIAEKAMTYN